MDCSARSGLKQKKIERIADQWEKALMGAWLQECRFAALLSAIKEAFCKPNVAFAIHTAQFGAIVDKACDNLKIATICPLLIFYNKLILMGHFAHKCLIELNELPNIWRK